MEHKSIMIRSVCFVIGDLDVGGAERHLTQITPALKQRGCAPFVYVTTHKGKLAPQLEAMGGKSVV